MPKSTLLGSFSVSLTRPGESDDTNIVFVHGSPARKGQKGQDANAENSYDQLTQSRRSEKKPKNFVRLDFRPALLFQESLKL